MKLELKHIAPYFPFKMKYKNTKNDNIYTMRSLSSEINMVDFGWGDAMELQEVIPIFKPMSELTENEAKDGHYMSGFSNYGALQILTNNPLLGHYFMVTYLLENHYDIFGLIEKGLAIDINNLKH